MSESTAQPVPTATDLAANEAPTQVAEVAAEVGFKVFAGNLTYSTDEAALKNFFSAFNDEISSIQIIFHGPRSAGYGFVTFKTEDAANKSIEALDKKELDGRPVIVERARPMDHTKEKKPRGRKLGGRRGDKAVPGETSDAPKTDGEAATAEPAVNGEAAPKPKKKRNTKKKTKKPAAEGEAVNGTADAAPATEGAEPTSGAEKTKKPRKPKAPRRPRGEAPTGEPSKSVLFVANLAYSVDETALTEFFTDNGVTVNSARVVRWRWGTPRKSKGYAFVDVGGEEEQKKAMDAVQGKSIADREVTVKIAVNSGHKEGEEDKAEGAPAADHAEPVVAA